ASLTPGFVPTGSAGATVTVAGRGFLPQSQVLTGAAPRQTAYVSATELQVTLTAAEVAAAGTLELRVQNPAPGGGLSNAAVLELRAPVPVIASLAAAQVPMGTSSFELRVNGTGFASNAEVRFHGAARPTRQVSPTQLEATLNVGDLQAAGSFEITVANPAPGGGVSNAVAFVVANPRPTVTSIDPDSVPQGVAAEVTVRGTGFIPQSQVILGVIPRRTVYISPTEVRALFSVEDMTRVTTYGFQVRNPAPGGGTSFLRFFSVLAPIPAVDSVLPREVVRRPEGFTARIFGRGFIPDSDVLVNLESWESTYVSPTELRIELTANDVLTMQGVGIRIHNPSPGGGMTLPGPHSGVALIDPKPAITGLSPAQATAGQPGLTLRLTGTGFVGEMLFFVNRTMRPMRVVSFTEIEAELTADDLREAGSYEIFVTRPFVGQSNSMFFKVVPATP
ncbi:MAG TPA: IPT/TIG domain-containing protein, partial [Longimicrobium sp.]|nr:IPT/TIG domain-containing protein [Longimicrobium sp.]